MAGPEVVVSFDSQGAAKVKQELGATDKQLAKLDKQLAKMQERKLFEELKSRSEAWQKALKGNEAELGRLDAALKQVKRTTDALASGANKFNEIFDAGGKIVGTAKALFEFGAAGASAKAVADQFERLGDLVPTLESLQRATAGVVDDTSLQGYAKLASDLGLTQQEISGLAQRATELAAANGRIGDTGEILTMMLKGEAEGMRALGVAIDTSDAKFQGLTETQKKLAIAQEQAALGSQAHVNAIDTQDAAFAKTQASIDNFLSTMQVLFSEILVESGVLDMVSAGLERIGDVADVIGPPLSVVTGALGLMSDVFSAVAFADVDALASALDTLGISAGNAGIRMDWMANRAEKLLGDLRAAKQELAGGSADLAEPLGNTKDELVAAALEAERVSMRLEQMRATGMDAADAAGDLSRNALSSAAAFEQAQKDQAALARGTEALKRLRNTMAADTVQGLVRQSAEQEHIERIGEGINRNMEFAVDLTRELDSTWTDTTVTEGEFESKLPSLITKTETLADETDRVAEGYAMAMAQLDLIVEQEELALDVESRRLEVADRMMQGLIALAESGIESVQGDAWGGGILGSFLGAPPEEVPSLLEEIAGAFDEVADSAASAWSSIGESLNSVEDWGTKASVATRVGSDLAKAFASTADASEKTDAGIAASGALIQAFVEDTQVEAALMTLVEGARAASAYAIGNIPGGIAHTGAAVSWGLAAAFSGGGGSSGGGGAGGAGAQQRQTSAAEVFQEPEGPSRMMGGSLTINVQSLNPNAAGEAVVDALTAFAESGGGGFIPQELIGTAQGRGGI